MPFIPYNTDYKHTRSFKKKSSKSYSKPEHAKLYYSRRWKRLRQMFIRYNPLCINCKDNDIIKEGEIIDHIKPVSEDIDGMYVWKNLQTLCRPCHSIKTAKEVNQRIKQRKLNNYNK